MTARQAQFGLWFVLTLVGCEDRLGPSGIAAPRFAEGDGGRHTVVVNPNANGNGVAATIQEGIDVVADGGRVLVMPGTYDEQITIDKGLTLEAIGGGSGPVIIEPRRATPASSGLETAISVITEEPVVIRDITLKHDHVRGLNALFIPADLTIERV